MKYILSGARYVLPDVKTVVGCLALIGFCLTFLGCDFPFDASESKNNTIVEVHDGGTVTIVDNESELSTEQIENKTRYEIPTRDGYKVVYQ